MKKKTVTKYSKICATIEPILQAFQSSYIAESDFSYVHYFLSKKRSTLT